jgi:hypothetical protein
MDDSLSVFVEHGEYASTILDSCVAVEGDVAEQRPFSPGVTNSSNFLEDGDRLASCSSYLSSRGEGYWLVDNEFNCFWLEEDLIGASMISEE